MGAVGVARGGDPVGGRRQASAGGLGQAGGAGGGGGWYPGGRLGWVRVDVGGLAGARGASVCVLSRVPLVGWAGRGKAPCPPCPMYPMYQAYLFSALSEYFGATPPQGLVLTKII